jgi:hypothetical protein
VTPGAADFFRPKKPARKTSIDEMTWTDYAETLEANLVDLHARVHTGAYRALPSRRRYIPKADGRQRPLGIAALEDKIVQAAVVTVLTPIYEAEFLGFSYGFRPKRNQHQALDALAFGIGKRRINWVLDCDVQSFFDKVSRDWLIRFVEHRIGDRRIVRTPNLSYAAPYLACALPCERFASALADNPRITRGRCGSLPLHRDGLPPSTSAGLPARPPTHDPLRTSWALLLCPRLTGIDRGSRR